MALWRIQPVAGPRDPRWQGRCIWKEVVVRAPTAAMARLIAASLDEDPRAPRVGNETLGFRSGFEDEKLYWAARVDRAATAALGGESGPNGIVRADILSHDPQCRRHARFAGPAPASADLPILLPQAA